MLVLMLIVFCIMMLMAISAGMLGWMLTHPFIVLAAIIVVALYETHKKDK